MKKVEAIKNKRQAAFMMQRLRRGKEIEDRRDIREVQRDLSLIRAPHAGIKQLSVGVGMIVWVLKH